VSISVCGLAGNGDKADGKDGLEDEKPEDTEAVRARRGIQRSRERGTSFIMWG
jgi:hypothetical protein